MKKRVYIRLYFSTFITSMRLRVPVDVIHVENK